MFISQGWEQPCGRFFNVESESVLSDSSGLRFQVFHSFWTIKKKKSQHEKKKGMRSFSKPSWKREWQQPYESAFAKSLALENAVFEFLRFSMHCYFKNWFSLFRPQSCNSILRICRCVHKALLLFSARKKTVSARFLHPFYIFPQLCLCAETTDPIVGRKRVNDPL